MWRVMSNNLILERFNYGPDGTFGKLLFPTGEMFWTVEKPWKSNTPYESCIPDGGYYLVQRHSPVVNRTSGGEFSDGWEVTDVVNRTFIMVHPANWPDDLEGCIGVGQDYVIMQNRKGNQSNAVASSRDAFREVMGLMDKHNDWRLDIMPFIMQYP